jgi:hypothetical protein
VENHEISKGVAGKRLRRNAVVDPDLEEGGHITIVLRRGPATGDPTRESAFESAPSYANF